MASKKQKQLARELKSKLASEGYREFSVPTWAKDLFIVTFKKHELVTYHWKGKPQLLIKTAEVHDGKLKSDAAWAEFLLQLAVHKKPASTKTQRRRANHQARWLEGWREFKVRDPWARKLFEAVFNKHSFEVKRFKRARKASLAINVGDTISGLFDKAFKPTIGDAESRAKAAWEEFKQQWELLRPLIEKTVDDFIREH